MVVEVFDKPVSTIFIEAGNFANDDLIFYALATIFIEVPRFFLCGYRQSQDVIYFAIVNLVSNFLLNEFLQTTDFSIEIILVGEFLVVALEFFLCSYWIKENQLKLLKVIFLTNFVSFSVGLLIL